MAPASGYISYPIAVATGSKKWIQRMANGIWTAVVAAKKKEKKERIGKTFDSIKKD